MARRSSSPMQIRLLLLSLLLVAVRRCVAFSARADPKARLRNIFATPTADAVLACPRTKRSLRLETSVVGGDSRSVLSSGEAAYAVNEVYADLVAPPEVISAAALRDELLSVFSMQTGFFRSPLAAFIYERGWRRNFGQAGFPGIEKEFVEAAAFFAPVATRGVVVDLSCGSGLMTRRLASSRAYERVLALDYSEEMLRETARRFDEENVARARTDAGASAVSLVRADAAALPLGTDSVDAVHAGAALHCWPRLEDSLGEVCRALRPGGRFYASTFFEGAVPGRTAQGGAPGAGSMRFFKDEAELRGLLLDAGFDETTLSVRREGRACAIIQAEKPGAAAARAD